MMKMISLAAGSVALALTASPAIAKSAPLPTETISTAGLDLETAEGQRLLDQRIEVAARRVCQVSHIEVGTRIRSMAARDCLKKARASARSQMAAIIERQQRGG